MMAFSIGFGNLHSLYIQCTTKIFPPMLGYLDDCKRTKSTPSIFQLMVFLHAADTPLALPMPFGLETLGVYVSRVFLIVMATVGWLLGYQTSYPEYYQGRKGR